MVLTLASLLLEEENERVYNYQFDYDPAQTVADKDDGSLPFLSSPLIDEGPQ